MFFLIKSPIIWLYFALQMYLLFYALCIKLFSCFLFWPLVILNDLGQTFEVMMDLREFLPHHDNFSRNAAVVCLADCQC